jgi:hypothetical protein
MFDRRGKGTVPTMADLSELDRRVLVRFYEPRNRRRAVGSILGISMVLLAGWWFTRTWLPAPRLRQPDLHVVAILTLFGKPLAFFTGIFAITIDIRRNWESISTHGLLWPAEIEYPGPVRRSIRSFFDGPPEFLRPKSGTP